MLKNILNSSHLCKQILNRTDLILSRKMATAADDVIIESIKDKGIITLNRPKVLNSLDLSMVKKILPVLIKWETEKSLVIVKGAGEKAFCAGGDVKSIAVAGLQGDRGETGQTFFKHEYTMNGIIGTYKIPYIAFIDGICMGGGVGLSVHGQYRIATERTLFAMPETQIGLFPDVGSSYFLPRLGGKLGLYLGLTGYRLKGWDVLKAGVATHYVDSKSLPALEKDLLTCNNDRDITDVLKKHSKTEIAEFSLGPYMQKIDRIFGQPTVEDIINELKKDNTEWAQDTIKLLEKMSPTSMKVTQQLLEKGSKLSSLHECLKMEYAVAYNTLLQKDFFEGVRALLIDKDQKPKWTPNDLAAVTKEYVDKHFSEVPAEKALELDPNLRNKL